MENLGAHTQRLSKAGSTHRHHHKFLNIHVVVCVLAAVENIHHRYRQSLGIHTANITIQRHTQACSRSLSHRQRSTENGISAQFTLIRSTIQLQQQLVNSHLIKSQLADQSRCDDLTHILHSLAYTLAQETVLVTVTQFHCLVYAGRCTGRHSGTPQRAILQHYLYFYSRIAAAIQNLSCVYINNAGHF